VHAQGGYFYLPGLAQRLFPKNQVAEASTSKAKDS
jgi:hypothetical protein